jgi:hypothetical protein
MGLRVFKEKDERSRYLFDFVIVEKLDNTHIYGKFYYTNSLEEPNPYISDAKRLRFLDKDLDDLALTKTFEIIAEVKDLLA